MKATVGWEILACAIFIGGCGAAPDDFVEEEQLGEVAESLVGGLRLGVYENGGIWNIDWNGDGINQAGEQKLGPFGADEDLPLIGLGGAYLCGTSPLHNIGTYRPSTAQYFIDSNASLKWDAGDTAVTGFGISNSIGLVWARPYPNFAGRCLGVLGWMFPMSDRRTTVWFVDANDDKALSTWNVAGGDLRYEFVVPVAGDLWPAPMWSATHKSTIMAVFNRSNGTWYIDKNNNKKFDGCNTDSCQVWGVANDIPFSNPNLPHRALSRWTTNQGVLGMHKLIDGNANGLWDPPNDASYAYVPMSFRGFYF